jgi:hypothetical protein
MPSTMGFSPPMNGRCTALLLCVGLTACEPGTTNTLLQPSQALGTVLAEEAARLAGANKTVALITPDAQWGSASLVEKAFKTALQARGCSITLAKSAPLGDPMSRKRVGLQPSDFFEAVQNAGGAGAVVSIAGAPLLTPEGAALLKPDHPPILVVATATLGDEPGIPGNRMRLESLLEAKIIQLAIVDGGEADAPSPGPNDSLHELFAEHYRILRPPH